MSISLISGFVLFFFILPTYSGYYIRVLFLIILLIAAILSYWLLFNQKNIIKILSKLSEDDRYDNFVVFYIIKLFQSRYIYNKYIFILSSFINSLCLYHYCINNFLFNVYNVTLCIYSKHK